MKVTQLFEGQDLSYDGDLKRVMGDTRTWLEKAGIGQHDVAEAMKRIKKLPEFEKIAEKIKYISTAKQEANGSLVFAADDWIAHVSAMGQIRFAAPSGWRKSQMNTFTRLASPKPGLVHGNPVASLVKTMKAALVALAKKPRIAKHVNAKAPVSEDIEPKSEGWYIKQQQSDRTWKIIAGPMNEEAADKAVEQKGGSKRGIAKAFISRLAIEKNKKALAEE